MADIQDQINKILSDPEALRQVQSLGEQLGISGAKSEPQRPEPAKSGSPSQLSQLSSLSALAPLINSGDDDVSRLLDALRPFLGSDKRQKLDRASQIIKFARLIPLIKDSGLFNL